ncbi:hypothetical protein B0A48_05512 [Cryoendolithus antarcticus]|uniref:SET domain-containing protein n=1 Tax=Cryoendolithus antarcticus TaxID=1507870 RepID=A0A1V8TIR7_9PEZI|nr:hypothetical protein B0A48_05512 [Cryoendolithus antarcticus]
MGDTKVINATADWGTAADELLDTLSLAQHADDVLQERDSDFAPSNAGLMSLVPIEVSELVHGQRAFGRRMTLQNETAEYGEGCSMICHGDEEILVHSFITYPFGRTSTSLPTGTLIDIKEPFMRKMDAGKIISVHHPTDMVYWPQHARLDHLRDPSISARLRTSEYMALGNAALLKNAPLTAAQLYKCARTSATSELNSSATITDTLRADYEQALSKEMFSYIRCGRFSVARSSLASLKPNEPETLKHYQQLARLGITVSSGLGCWDSALTLATDLIDQNADQSGSIALAQQMQSRVDEQLHGTYDFNAIMQQADRNLAIVDIADYAAKIEQRSSEVSGNGLFSKAAICPGSLLLFEKAFALTQPSERALVWKMELTEPGCRNRANTLLDKMADKSMSELEHWQGLFELYSGDTDGPAVEVDGVGIFDMYASRFNHSCVPNAQWGWVSNIMVVHASRPIAEGEELTTSYTAANQPYDKRKAALAQNGFSCTCPLCKADLSLISAQRVARKVLDKLPTRFSTVQGHDLAKVAQATLHAFSTHLPTAYPAELYASQNLPVPLLAGPLVALAHMTLGPSVSAWRSAPLSARAKATTYLHACLSLSLQVDRAYARSTSYCELLYKPHSQARFIGILALMALAELAHLSPKAKDKSRCAPLKWLAKQMYRIDYGEDVSFPTKHQAYACKDIEPDMGERPGEDEWGKCVEEAKEKGKAAWEFWKATK